MAGKLNVKQLAASGASLNQVLTWNGSSWVPANSGGGGGSARPALCFSKSHDPAQTSYPGSTTQVLIQYGTASTYQSISPIWWRLPAAVTGSGGQLNPGLRLYWSDASTTDLLNTQTSGSLTSDRSEVRFNKDGLRITQIAFIAQNTSGQGINTNLGEFMFEGEQT